jgi:Meckel syndrome type 1 protein
MSKDENDWFQPHQTAAAAAKAQAAPAAQPRGSAPATPPAAPRPAAPTMNKLPARPASTLPGMAASPSPAPAAQPAPTRATMPGHAQASAAPAQPAPASAMLGHAATIVATAPAPAAVTTAAASPAPSPAAPAAKPPVAAAPSAAGATSFATVATTPPRAAQSVAAIDVDQFAARSGPSRVKPRTIAIVAGAAVGLVVALVVGLRGRHDAPKSVPAPKAIAVAAPSAPVVVPSAPAVAAAPPVAAPAEDPAPEPERAAPAPHPARHVAVATKAHAKLHPKGRAARDVDATSTERRRPVRKVALGSATKEKSAGDREAARAAYERGNGLLFQDDAAGAAAAYQEAVRLAPGDPVGYRGLGLAYEKEGKIDDAISALVSYLKLSKHAHDREVIARRLSRLTHTRKK